MYFKNLATFAARLLKYFDHFRILCIKGLKQQINSTCNDHVLLQVNTITNNSANLKRIIYRLFFVKQTLLDKSYCTKNEVFH